MTHWQSLDCDCLDRIPTTHATRSLQTHGLLFPVSLLLSTPKQRADLASLASFSAKVTHPRLCLKSAAQCSTQHPLSPECGSPHPTSRLNSPPSPSQDCPVDPQMVVALGHQFPNYTYGANVGVHDLRMYVGPALSDAQVSRAS